MFKFSFFCWIFKISFVGQSLFWLFLLDNVRLNTVGYLWDVTLLQIDGQCWWDLIWFPNWWIFMGQYSFFFYGIFLLDFFFFWGFLMVPLVMPNFVANWCCHLVMPIIYSFFSLLSSQKEINLLFGNIYMLWPLYNIIGLIKLPLFNSNRSMLLNETLCLFGCCYFN